MSERTIKAFQVKEKFMIYEFPPDYQSILHSFSDVHVDIMKEITHIKKYY
jgi:hypothetical protein